MTLLHMLPSSSISGYKNNSFKHNCIFAFLQRSGPLPLTPPPYPLTVYPNSKFTVVQITILYSCSFKYRTNIYILAYFPKNFGYVCIIHCSFVVFTCDLLTCPRILDMRAKFTVVFTCCTCLLAKNKLLSCATKWL